MHLDIHSKKKKKIKSLNKFKLSQLFQITLIYKIPFVFCFLLCFVLICFDEFCFCVLNGFNELCNCRLLRNCVLLCMWSVLVHQLCDLVLQDLNVFMKRTCMFQQCWCHFFWLFVYIRLKILPTHQMKCQRQWTNETLRIIFFADFFELRIRTKNGFFNFKITCKHWKFDSYLWMWRNRQWSSRFFGKTCLNVAIQCSIG